MLVSTRKYVFAAIALVMLAEALRAGGEQEECAVVVSESPQAIALPYGCHTVGADIGTTVDVDLFSFDAVAGDQVRFVLDETSNSCLDPRIDIFGPGGFHEASECFPFCDFRGVSCSLIHVSSIAADGSYVIAISDAGSDETGTYTLQVERIVPDRPVLALAYNTTQEVAIDPTTDVDYFSFYGLAGGLVRITVDETSDNCLDPSLEVIDPSGNLIDSAFCAPFCDFRGISCSFVRDVVLPETGRYTLLLSDSGADETGTASISVTCILGCPPFAQVLPYNGSGSNPACYTDTFAPTLGGTWCAEVDASTNPGATVSLVAVCTQKLATPQPTAFGELLVNLSTEFLCSIEILAPGQTVARHSANVPANPALLGVHFYTQALTYAPGPPFGIELCNAIEYVAGY